MAATRPDSGTISSVPTPDVVIKFGWRDIPYCGTDQCKACRGWGVRSVLMDDNVRLNRHCPDCRGTGHDVVG